MDKSIKIWGSDDFQLYKILNAERNGGHNSSVNRMAWVGVDHPILVSVSDDRRMIFWDIEF
jgi:WD40 repeat protein